jgi:peroxiredoxin Q/BCP
MAKLQKLQYGQVAPDFSVTDITGMHINLQDYEGQKLVVCFFRFAGCPWCNLAIHRLTIEYPKFEKLGLKLVVFIESDEDNIKKYIVDRHTPKPPFPLISDIGHKIYDQYGVEPSVAAYIRSVKKWPSWAYSVNKLGFKQGKVDGSAFMVPAQFLIDGNDFTIYKASYGVDYYDQLPMVELLDFAQFGGE